MEKTTIAKLCCIYSGLVFGIFWIPLRALEQVGFEGGWAVLIFSLIPAIILSPIIIWRWRVFIPGRFRFHICSALTGLGFALYSGAFLYTQVIHVIVLFYLMPIWGFLIARLLIKERITPVRWLSMGLGLAGLLSIYSLKGGLPIPSNIGDWMALAAGVIWAYAALMLLTDNEDPVNYTASFMFWSAIASFIIVTLATQANVISSPVWDNLWGELTWLLPFAVLVLIPAAYATVFGPSQLNPGIVGLLFMTEISVGTTTAALFTDEPFGPRELTGVILITLAGIAEPLHSVVNRPSQTNR